MSKNEQELARLRTIVRHVLLKGGTSVGPRAQPPEEVDDAIGDLAHRRTPTLERESDAVLKRITDPEVERVVSDNHGRIMAAYGDAGYFVGLCMGLELAAITTRSEPTQGSTRGKRGRR